MTPLTVARRSGSCHDGRLEFQSLARVEKPLLQTALARTGGNQLRAAELLGINRNTLRKRILELGIDVPEKL